MGKLKEVFSEIMEDFDWEQFIIGICLAAAVGTFVMGVVMAYVFKNLAWLMLWTITMLAAGFAMGVNG